MFGSTRQTSGSRSPRRDLSPRFSPRDDRCWDGAGRGYRPSWRSPETRAYSRSAGSGCSQTTYSSYAPRCAPSLSHPPPSGVSDRFVEGWELRGALSRALGPAPPSDTPPVSSRASEGRTGTVRTVRAVGTPHRTNPAPSFPPPPEPPDEADVSAPALPSRRSVADRIKGGPPKLNTGPSQNWRILKQRAKELVGQAHSDACDESKFRAHAEQYALLVLQNEDPLVVQALLNCCADDVDVDELKERLADISLPDIVSFEDIDITLMPRENEDKTVVLMRFRDQKMATTAKEALRHKRVSLAKGGVLKPMLASADAVETMRLCLEWLIEEYDEKEGDVVLELLHNLRMPLHRDGVSTRLQGLSRLANLANALSMDHNVQSSPLSECSLVELLCLRLYTQRPIDIDRDFGFGGVPPPPHAGEPGFITIARQEYEKRFEDWNWKGNPSLKRNGSVFGPVCAALRDLGPGGKKDFASWTVLKRWVKWVCTIAAVTALPRGQYSALWRGIGAGGVSAAVVEQHRELREGGLLAWPALSSSSMDREQSELYMRGAAANSTCAPSDARPGTLLFQIVNACWGVPLAPLSAYPAESEILLPPLSVFRVESSVTDPENEMHGLLMRIAMLGPLGPVDRDAQARCDRFFARVRDDARRASQRLIAALDCGSEDGLSPLLLSPKNEEWSTFSRNSPPPFSARGSPPASPPISPGGAAQKKTNLRKEFRLLPTRQKLGGAARALAQRATRRRTLPFESVVLGLGSGARSLAFRALRKRKKKKCAADRAESEARRRPSALAPDDDDDDDDYDDDDDDESPNPSFALLSY
eukprot:Hpha_TRINITY_DN15358_c6_g1::TRINITY_DN15358_c6_g1_i1::g.87511::m.87511